MSTDETTTRLLAQLEEGMRLAPERQCPCGHRAREHRDGGCPCQDCDLRAFEVEQGCVTSYRDTDTRVSLQEHLDGIRSGARTHGTGAVRSLTVAVTGSD